MPRFTRRRRGFTLIELLVVFVVLAILASITLLRYRKTKERAYIAQIKTDMGQLRIAEEAYWSEHQVYSVTPALLDFNGSSDVTITITSADLHAGYDVEGVHTAAPGLLCTMYVGRAVNSVPSGDITCQ